ncbi:DUF3429 domain-containing protein [Paracoccaceae bacterium]|nr:DUF3429 domain-containing protein [Paracoccaceae bacterium]|tara:strand:- start:285 stop:716 length:432 start_codon:yes stop_codon:yes gene_type:complete
MFNGVPKSVVLASLLGLIPIFIGIASTFNIGLDENLKDHFIRIAIIYSGFILSFISGCVFYVSSLERQRVLLLWFSVTPVLLALLSIVIPFMQSFVLALGFLVVLELERKLHKLKSLPKWWLKLRLPMTSVVVLLLIFLGFRI